MREASEPGDEFQMASGILGGTVVGRSFAQELDSEPLILEVLGMLERQVTEHAVVVCRVRQVEARRQNVPRNGAGLWIGGEGARRSTKNISGYLVEQDAKRQRAVGIVLPVVEAALDRIGVEGSQPLANQFVEVGRSFEPIAAVSPVKPKFQNFV